MLGPDSTVPADQLPGCLLPAGAKPAVIKSTVADMRSYRQRTEGKERYGSQNGRPVGRRDGRTRL